MLEHPFLFSCSFNWLEHSQLRKIQLCQVYQGEVRLCHFYCNLKWFATNYKREENSASRGNGDLVCLLCFFFFVWMPAVPVKILLLDFFESICDAEIHR